VDTKIYGDEKGYQEYMVRKEKMITGWKNGERRKRDSEIRKEYKLRAYKTYRIAHV
jgi:hypothetical protein